MNSVFTENQYQSCAAKVHKIANSFSQIFPWVIIGIYILNEKKKGFTEINCHGSEGNMPFMNKMWYLG